MAKIALVAGQGSLPIIFSQAARSKGETIVAFGLKGVTAEELPQYVDKMHWLEWGQLQKALLLLAVERVSKLTMLGKIRKDVFFKDTAGLDDKSKSVLEKIKDKKDYSILNEMARVLGKIGIEVIDPTAYLADLIPAKGTLTKRGPSKGEGADIDYGVQVARTLSGLDIGQTVVVKDKTVIAIEAVEGTDQTILRAGQLIKGGFVVVKVARPDQDMRFDVPLIGLGTLKALIDAGGRALAIESGKTFLMDKTQMASLADENGISIVAV